MRQYDPKVAKDAALRHDVYALLNEIGGWRHKLALIKQLSVRGELTNGEAERLLLLVVKQRAFYDEMARRLSSSLASQ